MIFRYQTEIEIKKPIDEVFDFFSRAENLEKITPPWLRFKILSPLPIKMEAGTMINYRLSLYHLPLHWQTEITVWEPPYRFIDEQRRGPYKRWIHEHLFTEAGDGCLIKDKVQYQLYGWHLDRLVNKLFVQRDVHRIFNYRRNSIESLLR